MTNSRKAAISEMHELVNLATTLTPIRPEDLNGGQFPPKSSFELEEEIVPLKVLFLIFHSEMTHVSGDAEVVAATLMYVSLLTPALGHRREVRVQPLMPVPSRGDQFFFLAVIEEPPVQSHRPTCHY